MNARIIIMLFFPLFAFAQAPQKINFQSILRNSSGEIVTNKAVNLRISLLAGSANGSNVFTETHAKITDASGLISIEIGMGTLVSGVFNNINWGNQAHFIKLEADFNGGSNYVVLGTQELMSVPYALYAGKTDTSVLNLTSRLATKLNVADTAFLSDRIDAKLNKSDTSLLNLVNRFSSKVNVSDTSSMLTNYRNELSNKLNTSDTFYMLSNYWLGLNNKVNITDTSTMLNPYLRKSDVIVSVETDPVFNSSLAKGITGIDTAYWNRKLNTADTASMLTNYRTGLNNKVNISDTASMLQAYLRHADTTAMLANYQTDINSKVNIADTSDMLNPYLRKSDVIVNVETDPVFNTSIAKGITGIDTAYWNRKLNTADTASMLTNYRTGLNKKLDISDTASMLQAYLRHADTTAMLANYQTDINSKVNIADTSDMLNPYLRKADVIVSVETDPVFNSSLAKGITGIDTAYWNRKLNTADTASMLANYRTALNNKLNILDTTILSNRINTKLNISDFPLGTTPGNMQYWNGNHWVNLAPGLPGQVISMSSTGIPSWSGAAFPTLTTTSMSSITSTSANAGGDISSDGGATVSARGLVYGTTSNPTLSNTVLTIGSGTGSFSGTLTGLTPNTTYYVRAYATNSAGTGYGNEISFQTLPVAVPTLITTDASGITQTTVTSGGTISNDGGANVTERGIVYGTSTNPTTSNTKVTSGSGTGSFSLNVTSLTPNTTYYIRSYAINSAGTGYGNNITFQTTVPAVPSLTTRELLNITNTTATGGGSITNDGGSSITAKGICWGTSPNPTISDSKTTDGTGTTTFTSFITGLSANVTYYVRAYAINSTGTGYGNQQTFTASSTSNTLPVVTSTSVTGLTTVQATFNAEVNSQGGGTVTERGAVWNNSGNPTVNSNRIPSGAGTGVYTTTITGLSGGSNYYVRAYALNSFGISYGSEIPFSTPQGIPTVSINYISVQSTGAGIDGEVTDAGGQSLIERGVVWNTTGTPTILDNKIANGNSLGIYTTQISGLIIGSIYYVRTYATNASGTAYSNTRTITTALSPVVDIDGNYYDTVHIGNQIWFKQNLKTTRYRNGGNIPYVLGNTDWQALTTGAWSNYDHDAANDPIYGKLYNWYTTLGDTLCPIGWGVPTDDDWTTLTTYLGGESVAGGKMKSIGTAYWYSPNTGATNESGFSVLPGGFRSSDGSFYNIRINAFFWSATENGSLNAWFRYLGNDNGYVSRSTIIKSVGASVRCLRD